MKSKIHGRKGDKARKQEANAARWESMKVVCIGKPSDEGIRAIHESIAKSYDKLEPLAAYLTKEVNAE